MLAGLALVCGDAAARVSPLASIEQQVQKPNMLFLLDVSGSMMLVPGTAPADFFEAGMDCDRGDNYCRTLGTQNRCYFSAAGSKGQGVFLDPSNCTSNAQCQVSYCAPDNVPGASSSIPGGYPKYCTTDADCSVIPGDTCQSGLCKGSAAAVTAQSAKTCTSDSDCITGYCRRFANDFCVTNTTSQAKIKMCRIAQTPCQTDTQCTAVSGDTCGPASSRLVLAKSAMKRVVNEFYDNVNFGFMTFGQTNYYPYYEATSAITYSTRETFIPRTQLEFANCFTTSAGPSASCVIKGTTYTRKATTNSRYRLNKGLYYDTHRRQLDSRLQRRLRHRRRGHRHLRGDVLHVPVRHRAASVRSGCSTTSPAGCASPTARRTSTSTPTSPSATRTTSTATDRPGADPIGPTNSGLWDPLRCAVHGHQPVPAAGHGQDHGPEDHHPAREGVHGRPVPAGRHPTGMSLKNDDDPDREHSAYYYLKYVQQQNAANGVACRPEATLLL